MMAKEERKNEFDAARKPEIPGWQCLECGGPSRNPICPQCDCEGMHALYSEFLEIVGKRR